MRFFIVFQGTIYELPVNPEEFSHPMTADTTTVSLVNSGERELPQKRKPFEFEIKSFLPRTVDGPYVQTKSRFRTPKSYMLMFKEVMEEEIAVRLIVTGYDLPINMRVIVTSFVPKSEFGTDDIEYELELVEYQPPTVKVLKPVTTSKGKKKATPKKADTRQKTGFAVGDRVIVNGKYWYDSYGSPPNGTFKNYHGKISKIVKDKKRKYRYHITTPSGGWRGWVAESQLKHDT